MPPCRLVLALLAGALAWLVPVGTAGASSIVTVHFVDRSGRGSRRSRDITGGPTPPFLPVVFDTRRRHSRVG